MTPTANRRQAACSREPSLSRFALALLTILAVACDGDEVVAPVERGPAPAVTPPAPTLRRLTQAQYANTVRDLLGADIVLPASLEPDAEEDGLLSVGAGTASVSSLGVERYEDAALLLADQVADDPTRFATIVPCTPTTADDAVCADTFVRTFGRRAWRRPLTEAEASRLVSIVTLTGGESGAFAEGVRYGLAAMLQSPHFVYRREHGTPDADDATVRLLTDWELATRLSYLLWATTPDATLLDAAAAGDLQTDEGLRAQADRLLADDRARTGVRELFTELFELGDLDTISKDPTVFTHASADLGPAAREETLLGLEHLIFDAPGDFRDLITTPTTFVDPRLASLYRIAAPDPLGFGQVTLDEADGRRGLLGQASFLMLNAHSTRTSATLRGKFIRTTLLCQTIPPPPADVDTSIPEADSTSPTLRDRLQTHLENPTCAGCHQLTDPIGLGLENFDGIGRWRDTENDVTIDASGELDQLSFSDGWELGAAVRDNDNLGPCFASHLYRYAMGHSVDPGEEDVVDWIAEGFVGSGHDWQSLLVDLVMSPAFRRAGALDE
ncbi:MAG: DUF1592 domain-containing protein [Pseudomonadota bacterium]|nr:DUF1592 domain-containing protein [Pseudomonadota bacterium]